MSSIRVTCSPTKIFVGKKELTKLIGVIRIIGGYILTFECSMEIIDQPGCYSGWKSSVTLVVNGKGRNEREIRDFKKWITEETMNDIIDWY